MDYYFDILNYSFRVLACGNHLCEQPCHLGNCIDCPLLPENLKTCPCLKVDIVELLGDEKRTSCLDAIPTCESFCGKKLYCGSQGTNSTISFCIMSICTICIELYVLVFISIMNAGYLYCDD